MHRKIETLIYIRYVHTQIDYYYYYYHEMYFSAPQQLLNTLHRKAMTCQNATFFLLKTILYNSAGLRLHQITIFVVLYLSRVQVSNTLLVCHFWSLKNHNLYHTFFARMYKVLYTSWKWGGGGVVFQFCWEAIIKKRRKRKRGRIGKEKEGYRNKRKKR